MGHTCGHQLDLPDYDDAAKLRAKMALALARGGWTHGIPPNDLSVKFDAEGGGAPGNAERSHRM